MLRAFLCIFVVLLLSLGVAHGGEAETLNELRSEIRRIDAEINAANQSKLTGQLLIENSMLKSTILKGQRDRTMKKIELLEAEKKQESEVKNEETGFQ